jgi:hypothetical protein
MTTVTWMICPAETAMGETLAEVRNGMPPKFKFDEPLQLAGATVGAQMFGWV